MNILTIGDVYGRPGVDFLMKKLPQLKRQVNADLTVVNGENACVNGINPRYAEDIFAAGADVITLGNHAFDNRQIVDFFDDNSFIIRPFNMPPQRPGEGVVTVDVCGRRVCVANLIGRVHMDYNNNSPFTAADEIISTADADIFVFDFHAEATSEKLAMAFYLDGRASVLFGTHTHVNTADYRVFPKGMGYITDLGMTGGTLSVIGASPDNAMARFLGSLTGKLEASDEDIRLQGALFEIENGGKCKKVSPIEII